MVAVGDALALGLVVAVGEDLVVDSVVAVGGALAVDLAGFPLHLEALIVGLQVKFSRDGC